MNKKQLLVTTGVLGCLSVPAFAGPVAVPPAPIPHTPASECSGLRGSIGVTLGHTFRHGSAFDGGNDDSYSSALAELRLGMDFGSNWYGQLDVIGEFTNGDTDDDETYERGTGAVLHLMHSPTSIGLFGGWYEASLDDSSDYARRYVGGVEGLFSTAGIDFQWQVGAIFSEDKQGDDGDQSIHDAYFGRLAGTKNLGNGWSVTGEAVFAHGEMDENDNDVAIYGWGLEVEKTLSPNWSLALVYSGATYEQENGDGDAVEHFIGLNSTFYFGSGSDAEDCRPTLGMPAIMRWLGVTGGMDAS